MYRTATVTLAVLTILILGACTGNAGTKPFAKPVAEPQSLKETSKIATKPREKTMPEISHDMPPVPQPEDDTVYFAFDSSTLTEQGKSVLFQHALYLSQYKNKVLRLQGHSDSQGNAVYNEKLSIDRAYAVVDFLVRQGVHEQQIKVESFGERVPHAEKTDHGRNRRVEIIYLDDISLKQ